MKLVVVESPAKCKKIEGFLGDGYKCIASYGHIRTLDAKNGMKCIDVNNNFTPTFIDISEKQKNIDTLRQLAGKASEVIIATDDDREGEGIGWHICVVCDLPLGTTKRIIFHEITKSAILQAVKNPTRVNMDIVQAQQARQVLDFEVGFMLSPILWKNISRNTKDKLSAGRCQTPALRIVYDNQKDIDASPGKKVYNTVGYFTSKTLPFNLSYNHNNEEVMEDFLMESGEHEHIYSCSKPRKSTKNPPTPFTTSTLQQTASGSHSISPKETMQIAQKLYEGGFITYMRTDSKTYSKEFIDKVIPYVKDKYGEEYIGEQIDGLSLSAAATAAAKPKKSKKAKGDSKGDAKGDKENPPPQEAHEAIRPTNILVDKLPEGMTPKENRLYYLIWRNTLESCMSKAEYTAITASITCPEINDDARAVYKYSAEQVVFPGWQAVNGYEKENANYHYLLTIKEGSELEYKKVTSKVSMKELKSHYTEAKLVQLLEEKGIGRPSTFSSLIDKIQERGFVKKQDIKGKKMPCKDFELVDDELDEKVEEREFGNERGKLVVQPVGILALEFLMEHFGPLFDYSYTKEMEDALDHIAKGEKVWHELTRDCYNQINTLAGELDSKGGVGGNKLSIKIDDKHSYIIGKNGPVIMCNEGKSEEKDDNGQFKDKISFKTVKPDIDLDALRTGKLTLEDIVDTKGYAGRRLGEYEDQNLILKKGQFGYYVQWGENRKSVGHLKCDECDITYEMVVSSLGTKNENMVREINNEISIRTGKYGHYIFYKTPAMKKPKFIKLNDFDKEQDYKTCDKKIVEKYVAEHKDDVRKPYVPNQGAYAGLGANAGLGTNAGRGFKKRGPYIPKGVK